MQYASIGLLFCSVLLLHDNDKDQFKINFCCYDLCDALCVDKLFVGVVGDLVVDRGQPVTGENIRKSQQSLQKNSIKHLCIIKHHDQT